MMSIRRSAPGLGQVYRRQIDPTLDLAFAAAGMALSRTDPQSPETFELVRRIVAAPPLFPSSVTQPGGGFRFAKLSDINPFLRVAATGLENKAAIIVALIALPIAIFAAGVASGRRRSAR